MRREDIRAFLDRRWDLVRDEKLAEDARFFREHGAAGCLRVSAILYEHTRSVTPQHAKDRAEDLAGRIAWRALLERTDRGRTAR